MDHAVEPHQSLQLNFSSSDLKLSKENHKGMLTNNTKRALISFFGRGTHARSREDMVFAILTGPTQLKNDTKYQPSPGFLFTAAWQHLTQKLQAQVPNLGR